MNSKLLTAEGAPVVSFPTERVRRAPQKGIRSFVITLLLVALFLTIMATLLVHYPQKVDAFLNSDEPVESKHVVTR